MNQSEAREIFTKINNNGEGYAPYMDVAGDDTVEAAVAAAIDDDWDVILAADNSDDVVVLRNADGEMMIIGDAHGAWAVTYDL